MLKTSKRKKKTPHIRRQTCREPAVAEVEELSGIFNNCFYFNKEAGGKSLPWAAVTRSSLHESQEFCLAHGF